MKQNERIRSTNVNNVHNEFNVWYKNNDTFLNKIDELKLSIYNADTIYKLNISHTRGQSQKQ